MNLAAMLDDNARYFPDRPAVIEDEKTISFFPIQPGCQPAASALVTLGLESGGSCGLVRAQLLCLAGGLFRSHQSWRSSSYFLLFAEKR